MARTDDLWFELHIGLPSHPKTARLRRRLGVGLATAVGHVTLLWAWAVRYAPNGDLSRFDADVIADASGWDDEAGLFVRALIGAGFLDESLAIHDWDAYVGRLIDRREANAERMRLAREAHKRRHANGAGSAHVLPDERSMSGPRAAHVQGLPDRTGQNLNRTGPDPSPKPPSHGDGGEVLTELGEADEQLWAAAREELRATMTPGNWDQLVGSLEPLGRTADGGLVVRAPPGQSIAAKMTRPVQRALFDAGDRAATLTMIVEA